MDDFEIIKVIGRGSFAKVYQVRKIDKNTGQYQYYALKVLKKKTIYEKN
jgi:p70 ribosomal S6 kinase